MNKNSKIYVAGHRGLVGQAFLRQLVQQGYQRITVATSDTLDLRRRSQTNKFFADVRPDYVFLAAAKVGGIIANDTQSADFIRDNLAIESNVIEASRVYGVTKLLFFGSACAYPKFALCPIQESSLMTGELEPTNRAYAIAKIAGIEMCNAYRKQYNCDFISCMPTNIYGPGDSYNLENSHVLPGMIRRIHEAKVAGKKLVTLWGTGKPTREFLFSDDLARAAIFLMNNYQDPGLINISSGQEIELSVLAETIRKIVGYAGFLWWDTKKPDGTPRRALDIGKISRLGWKPEVSLEDGIKIAYKDFLTRL